MEVYTIIYKYTQLYISIMYNINANPFSRLDFLHEDKRMERNDGQTDTAKISDVFLELLAGNDEICI
jgi:hypothetical protein